MNKSLLILGLSFTIFTACKNTDTQVIVDTPEETNQIDTTDHHEHSISEMKALSLNNGEKWKSDESTNTHAQNLIDISNKFESQDKSLTSFHNYANDVEKEMAHLIKGCTMKGQDHDALHLWLEPILVDVKELKNSEEEAEAKNIAQNLSQNIVKFTEFFLYAD